MRRFRTIGLSLLLFFVPLVTAVPAGAADGKLSTALLDTVNNLLPSDQVNVIVQTDGPPSLLLRTLVTTLGGVVGANFTSINGFPARLSVSGILTLVLQPGVQHVSLDWQVLTLADSAAPYSGATRAWKDYGVSGKGVGVAVIDSGLADHP